VSCNYGHWGLGGFVFHNLIFLFLFFSIPLFYLYIFRIGVVSLEVQFHYI
jgi:hypothetical protein